MANLRCGGAGLRKGHLVSPRTPLMLLIVLAARWPIGRVLHWAGVTDTSFAALRPFAAEGLHSALYVVPVFGLLLGFVLFAASRTVTRDTEKLQHWMRQSAAPEAPSYASVVGVSLRGHPTIPQGQVE